MPTAVIHDLGNVLRTQFLAPALITATSTVTNKDFANGDGRCTLLVDVGTWSGTSLSVQVTQSATTNGTYTNITGASVSVTTGTTLASVTFDRDNRYLGLVATFSGTTAGLSASVVEAYKKF
jgi:hypothetical protein